MAERLCGSTDAKVCERSCTHGETQYDGAELLLSISITPGVVDKGAKL